MRCGRPRSTPSSEPDYQARVRLTGSVPIADEEFATVKEGMVLHGIGTVFVVLFILWLALKSGRIILAVFLSLAGGLAITAALGFLMVGSLNMISVAFFVLFVGLGVDFCIQYSVRYRDERYHKDDLKTALVDAGRDIGAPLALAAAATAAGFLAFLPTNYQGVSELGTHRRRGHVRRIPDEHHGAARAARGARPARREGAARLCELRCGRQLRRAQPKVRSSPVTLGIAIIGLPLLYFLRFDFNPINLRSPTVESIATYLDLRQDPNTGASAINVLAGSREGRAGSRPQSWRSCPKSSASCRSKASCPTIRRPSSH